MTALPPRARRVSVIFSATLIILALTQEGQAQTGTEPNEQWVYASFFGTGWYRLNENRDVYVLKVVPRWTVGEAGFDDEDNRNVAITYRVPMTFGLSQFDFNDVPGILDPDNLSTASLAFGMDVDVPLSERFSLRPLAEVGYARVLGESDSAWTYKAELRSRYSFRPGKLEWDLLANLGFVGATPKAGNSDNFTFATLAAEFGYPVDWFGRTDSQTMFYWSLGYTEFIDEIGFDAGVPGIESVSSYWQAGVAVGKRDTPVRVWFLNFDRLGVAYNYGNTGQLRGIRFVFRSLYDI
jgi:hypothetical protein